MWPLNRTELQRHSSFSQVIIKGGQTNNNDRIVHNKNGQKTLHRANTIPNYVFFQLFAFVSDEKFVSLQAK